MPTTFKVKNCLFLMGIISLLLYLHIPFVRNVILLFHNCVEIDFAVYQQAIYDSFYFFKANPYVGYLREYILQDHFDPVYMIAGPFVALFDYSPYSLLLLEYLFLVTTLAIIYFYSKTNKEFLLFFTLIALSRVIPNSFGYPVHVGTWAILPMTLFAISLKRDKTWIFWLSVISLMFFKEVFPIAGIGLAISLFFLSEKKKGLILFFISTIFCIFNFILREDLLNSDSMGFYNRADYFFDVVPWFLEHALSIDRILKWLFVLSVPITIILYCSYKKLFNKSDYLILGFWLPLLFIHYFHNSAGYHYEVFISFLPLFLVYDKWHLLSKPFIIIMLAIQFCSSASEYFKLGSDFLNQRYVLKNESICTVSKEKRKDVLDLYKEFSKVPDESSVFVPRDTVGGLLNPNIRAFGYGGRIIWWEMINVGFKYHPKENYDYIVLGKLDGMFINNGWKRHISRIDRALKVCKGTEVIIDSDHYLFAKGPFSHACIEIL